MKTFILLLLTLLLTGCYTSFQTVQDRPQRTVITSSTPTLITYNYPSYQWYWNGYTYVYIQHRTPRYYVYNTYVAPSPTVRNNRTVQPRSTGVTNRNLERNREIRSGNREVRRPTPRNRNVEQRPPTRTRGEVNRSSNTRTERSSNRRTRNNN